MMMITKAVISESLRILVIFRCAQILFKLLILDTIV